MQFTKSHSKLRWLALALIIIPVLSILAGCSSPGTMTTVDLKMAPMGDMPASVQSAPVTVREAYQYAVANPEALKNVLCPWGQYPLALKSSAACGLCMECLRFTCSMGMYNGMIQFQ